MSKKLSEDEKERRKIERQLRSDEKAVQNEIKPPVDKYGAKILRILREEAPAHPEIKYNSTYFEERFNVANITMLASGENNLHESGEINQKKSKEKSHYQF